MKRCNCWVKDEPPEGRFELRNGAHNPSCPVYRVSLDPVDALKDADIRERYDPETRWPRVELPVSIDMAVADQQAG